MQSGYDGFNSFKLKKAEEIQELNEKMESMTRKVMFPKTLCVSSLFNQLLLLFQMEAYSPERFSSIESDLESCRAQLSSATSENLELRQKLAECDLEKCRLGKELDEANAVRKEGVRQCGLWGGTKAGCGVAENSAGGVKARREIFRHQDHTFAVYQNGI